MAQNIENPDPKIPTPWPAIRPLRRSAPPATFPVERLPKPLGQFVASLATATQTPPGLGGLLSLAALSLTIAKKARVETKPGWTAPLNLYVCPDMPPGTGKSHVFEPIVAPLRKWEREREAATSSDRAHANAKRLLLQHRADAAEKALLEVEADANAEEQALNAVVRARKALAEAPPSAPPRMFTSDVTPEALARLLASNGELMGVFSDEGAMLLNLMGHYSGGKSKLDLLNHCWKGGGETVDRVTGGVHIRLNEPLLCIGITIQPHAIDAMTKNADMVGLGAAARFLYARLNVKFGERDFRADPVSEATQSAHEQVVRALLELPREASPVVIGCSKAARARFLLESKRIDRDMAPGERLAGIRGWAGKLTSQIARIAGILHAVQRVSDGSPNPLGGKISERTMADAIAIGRWCEGHALAVLGTGDDASRAALAILGWLRKTDANSFSIDEARQLLKNRKFRGGAEVRDRALQELELGGYVRRLPLKVRGKGRPPTVYEVSPKWPR